MNLNNQFKLSAAERETLRTILRQRKVDGLVLRRANVLLLLDKGWCISKIAEAFFINIETVRDWRRQFIMSGLDFLPLSSYSQREGHLNFKQEQNLKEYLTKRPPRSTDEVREYIKALYDCNFSRSGAIKLMHRLGFSYKKPKILPLQATEDKQQEFIKAYEMLINGLYNDEAIVFVDGVHPEHQSKPAHGWFLKDSQPAIPATSGRKRLNIHGGLNLETFDFQFVEAEKINAKTTRQLLEKLEAAHQDKSCIHVFLDNARYHHAKILQPWLQDKKRRVKLHFLPAYAPHLNPIERLWKVMHKWVTHNKYYAKYDDFTEAILQFFRVTIPENWKEFRDTVTDNFKTITRENYQIIG